MIENILDALEALKDKLDLEESQKAWEAEPSEDEEFCLQAPIEQAEAWDESFEELDSLGELETYTDFDVSGWEEVKSEDEEY